MAEKSKKAVKKMTKSAKKRKTEKRAPIIEGRIYINATFNNTIITITDAEGKVAAWITSGSLGFSGTRKSTPYAAITTVTQGLDKATQLGLRRVRVFVKGPGPGREAGLKVLRAKRDLDVISISDVTPIPHNGPRPPKMKRG